MLIKRIIQLMLVAFILPLGIYAQVTTSSMSGVVKTDGGDPLVGATVIATHKPTGTVYSIITRAGGRFDIQNMNPGGPYDVIANFVGYGTNKREELYLALGDEYRLDFVMGLKGTNLAEVVISGTRSNRVLKNGASTNISNRQLNTLPTISRSINDFTRLTPQGGNGSSFNGRDGRFNNITIDGANFNNNFGLSGNNLPGGDAQPISLDAIEEVSVNISPFDVKQGNFTGAGINAITRGGTNTMSGSAYHLWRNEKYNGKNVGDAKLTPLEKTTNKIYGARVGGPIIKNKLFFFLNGEYENREFPGLNWLATRPGVSGPNVSRTTASDLDLVSAHLKSNYGYETGPYEKLGNFNSENIKYLGRLDWNINNNHRLSARYNYVKSTNDQATNGNSAPNPRSSSNRWSQNSMAFANSNYAFQDIVSSLTFDLKSKLSKRINNQLLVTLTDIQTDRSSGSSPFPFVDILQGGDAYMSFGYELFSWMNGVQNKVNTFTDNVSINLGKHSITAGASYDYLYFGNSFLRYGTSYYRFNSVNDFITNQAPAAFALTYGYGGKDPIAELEFGQLAAYIQDEIKVNDHFKLLGGVRVDKAIYLKDPPPNPAVNAKVFRDLNNQPYQFDVSTWPESKLLWSPRLGFNWDVAGDRNLIIRGGTGIFTGRLPFVWFTNQPTNSFALQATVEVVGAGAAAYPFSADPRAHVNKFPQSPTTLASGASLAQIDKDFVFPQVWRTSMAFDKKLPWDLLLTMEAIYTKDVNGIYQYNANYAIPNDKFTAGPDQRPRFSSTAARSVDVSVREAMVLTNTNQGGGFSYSAQLSRNFKKGFYGQISYSNNLTLDLSNNPGSQAASAWSNLNTRLGANSPQLAQSQFSLPHRFTGAFSYKFDYLKRFATTISLFYEGSNQFRFTYKYSTDANNDGLSNDLMYIPASRAEAGLLIPNTAQADAYWAYAMQDKYLRKHLGQYAEPFGALAPWFHRLDLRVLQDVSVKTGDKKHTLQFSLDMLNFANFLSSKWGTSNRTVVNNSAPLRYSTMTNGVPQFTMNTISGGAFPTKTFEPNISVASTWGMQLGVRYIF